MTSDKAKDLFVSLFEGIDRVQLSEKSGVTMQTIDTIRCRYNAGKGLNITMGNVCRLAEARGLDPAATLMKLVTLRLEGGKEGLSVEDDGDALAAKLRVSLQEATQYLEAKRQCTALPHTLQYFPDAFAGPFYVVTGDRREVKGARFTPADFGAIGSSPADLRHVYELGLPRDTQIITDKIFVLEPLEELRKRFANATLIICGSPASNHAARIINRFALHRFNMSPQNYRLVEDFLREAWYAGRGQSQAKPKPANSDNPIAFFTAPEQALGFDHEQLRQLLRDSEQMVKFMGSQVFGGGLIDPTYLMKVRGLRQDPDKDYGIITLARNPFRPDNDGLFPALYLAGYHLPGTSYATHGTIWKNRTESFARHPLGGVIEVSLMPRLERPYYIHERMEHFAVEWEDRDGYTTDGMLAALSKMSDPKSDHSCQMSIDEAQELHTFVSKLLE